MLEPTQNRLHIKEGHNAPPLLFNNGIIAITSAIYAGGGFGSRFITETAFFITLSTLLLCSRKRDATGIAVILGLCIFIPAFMQVAALMSTILIYCNRPKHAILVLLGSALQMLGGINPFYIPFILVPFIVISSVQKWNLPKKITATVSIILLGLNLAPTLVPQEAPRGHLSFAFPYRIDIATNFQKGDDPNTYTSIDDHGDFQSAKVQVLEHDPPHSLASHNWNQKRLWTENHYFGAPLYRIATALDGFLYSNLGCRVDGPQLRLLGEAHKDEYNSFISKKNGQLVFSDSDFLTNGAAGYQNQLNTALFRSLSIAHFILYGTAITALLVTIKKTKFIVIPLIATLALTTWFLINHQKIDIRICDTKPIWPHSKGVGGIGTEVNQEIGVITVGRHGRARILAVGRDSNASLKNEKVIVMEGNSTVKIGGYTYEAIDLPMGQSEGIMDAIPIRKLGSNELGKATLNLGIVKIIGTNSARNNLKKIHDAAK
jgi:hypothetical protein